MRTYTHTLLHIALRKRLGSHNWYDEAGWIAGAAVPDIPLILITGIYVLVSGGRWCEDGYNDHYFNNPVWIASHNLFHAPLPLLALYLIGQRADTDHQPCGKRLMSLAIGCGLHCAIDIPTHHNDGPVLGFPLDWHARFNSPISYWDPEHGGRWMSKIEAGLCVYLLYKIISDYSRNRSQKIQ